MDIDLFLHSLYTKLVPESFRWNLGENLYNVYQGARRKASGARLGSAFLGDITVKYLEWGRPQLPKILLLHGFSDSKDGVLPYAQELSRRYHVIAPDIPGFGESEKPALVNYDLPQFAAWITRFADKIHFDRFIIAGHSLGGAIAAEIATQSPQRVQRLILISAAGLVPSNDGENIYEKILRGNNPFEVSTYENFREFFAMILSNPGVAPLPVKSYLYMRFAANRTWYHKIFQDIMGNTSDEDAISDLKSQQYKKFSSLKAPTLIVWGKHDGFFPESIGSWMHRTVPDSRYAIIEEAAHMAPMEQSKKLAKLTLAFLNA